MKIKQLEVEEVMSALASGDTVYRLKPDTGYLTNLMNLSLKTINKGFECDEFVYFTVK